MVEVDSTLIVGAIGAVTTVIAYVYNKGNNDSDLSSKVNRHELNIDSLSQSHTEHYKIIEELQSERIRIQEALNRTYASREFVYREFVSVNTFNDKYIALEEKLVALEEKMINKMDGLRESIEMLIDIKRGVKTS